MKYLATLCASCTALIITCLILMYTTPISEEGHSVCQRFSTCGMIGIAISLGLFIYRHFAQYGDE